MATNRLHTSTAPLDILKRYMKSPAKSQELRESTATFLEQDMLNRVFNKFPLLISDNFYAKQTNHITNILLTASACPLNTDGNMRVLNADMKAEIATIAKSIALLGCKSFIKNNVVNPELVELLEWKRFESKLDICKLISAFTAETLLNIIKKANEQAGILLDQPAFDAVNNHLNKHYHAWVVNAIHASGNEYHDTAAESNMNTITMVSTAVVTGLLFAGSVALAMAVGDPFISTNNRRR